MEAGHPFVDCSKVQPLKQLPPIGGDWLRLRRRRRQHERTLELLAYLDSFPFGSVYCIDIDTNGEVDCSFTQLPLTALAWAAAELEP
jgi:hypothetical protein